jgi:hypothetical protein
MDRSARTQNLNTLYSWTPSMAPSRCEVCGRTLAPSGTDWANQWYTNTYAPLMDNLTRMWSSMAQPWSSMTQPWGNMAQPWGSLAQAWMTPAPSQSWPSTSTMPHTHQHHGQHHGHHHDCGCDHGDCDGCHGDQCHCRCCIADADLVVYARVGERRVVPLTIENPRRREQQVKLGLSNFTSHGRTAANIKAQIAGPAEFTVPPCQEHEAILLIEASSPAGEEDKTTGSANEPSSTAINERRAPDVDDCEIFYADLLVEGCETRPVRIALALLPRDCAGFKVDCGCNCC